MAGWKLRKDKTPAETPNGETLSGETSDGEIPDANPSHAEPSSAGTSHTDFEIAGPAQTYDLNGSAETKDFDPLDSLRHFSSFESEPEAHFTDLDFDSDPEDLSLTSQTEHPDSRAEHGDGPLTLVDYTEPEAAPTRQEFSLHGAQIFEMPPPAAEMPEATEMPPIIEMPLPAVEAPSFIIAAPPPVIEAPPPITEAAPPVQAEDAPEEDFPERLRTGRFDRSELAPSAPAPYFGIPAVSPFVLDTPGPAAPPAPPQLVVRVGRLSAPFLLAKDVTTIGRPDSALHYYPDVEIDMDDAVSRRHAEVVKRGDSYYLVDTGSTNGTLLNGEKLPPQAERLLAYGDRIRVGDRTEITFE